MPGGRGRRRGRGLPPQAGARPGRRLRRVRRDRPRGPRRRTAAGRRGPRLRHAGGRPQLPGHRQHRPGGAAQRQPGADAPRPRPGRLLRPVRLARGRAARAGAAAATSGCPRFVSAGNRADVSGNDLLQYWATTRPPRSCCCTWRASATRASSPGWPAARPHQAGRRGQERPARRHAAGLAGTSAAVPEQSVAALFASAGVIRVDTVAADVRRRHAAGPPAAAGGRRVAIVGNSPALAGLAAEACVGNGLRSAPLSEATRVALRTLHGDALVDNPAAPARCQWARRSGAGPRRRAGRRRHRRSGDGFRAAPARLRSGRGRGARRRDHRHGEAGRGHIPGSRRLPGRGERRGRRRASSGPDQEGSAGWPRPFSLARGRCSGAGPGRGYAEWRRRPEGEVPALPDVDAEAARAVVERSLLGKPEGGALSGGDVTQLFAAYGVQVFSAVLVDSADEAAAGSGWCRLSGGVEGDGRAAAAPSRARHGDPRHHR